MVICRSVRLRVVISVRGNVKRKASNSVVSSFWSSEYPFPVLQKPATTLFVAIIAYPFPRTIFNPTFYRIEIIFFGEFH